MTESEKCITVPQNQNNNKPNNIPNKPGATRMACYKQTKKDLPRHINEEFETKLEIIELYPCNITLDESTYVVLFYTSN